MSDESDCSTVVSDGSFAVEEEEEEDATSYKNKFQALHRADANNLVPFCYFNGGTDQYRLMYYVVQLSELAEDEELALKNNSSKKDFIESIESLFKVKKDQWRVDSTCVEWLKSEDSDRCRCGYEGITNLFTIYNELSGNRLEPIGSECIKLFDSEIMTKVVNSMLKAHRHGKKLKAAF